MRSRSTLTTFLIYATRRATAASLLSRLAAGAISSIVGNGAEVRNEGQVTLKLAAEAVRDGVILIKSVFQVAEITRPLRPVSRVCDLGHRCIFDADKAEFLSKTGTVLCTFKRKGVLYVAQMKFKAPEGSQRPA